MATVSRNDPATGAGPAPRPTREPVQARSRATQSQVLTAAITCLGEIGWSRTTMAEIAARAGISRGALQHHFPTREDLITTALENVAGQRLAYLQSRADQLGPEPDAETVLRLLVDTYLGESFRAALQLWAAAVGDPELHAKVEPLERRFAREAHTLAITALRADDHDPQTRAIVQATLDFARGLGLANTLTDDSRRRARVIKAWLPVLEGISRTDTKDGDDHGNH